MMKANPILTVCRPMVLVAILAMGGLHVCGGSAGTPSVSPDIPDVVDPPDEGQPPPDVTKDTGPIEDIKDTTATEDAQLNSCDPTPDGLIPSYCPCEENSDCVEGYCVPSSIGKVCTETCVNECPSGWSCELVSGTGSDTIFLCLPKPLTLGGYLLGDGFSLMSGNSQFFLHHTLGAPRIIGTSTNSSFQLTSGLPQGGL